MGGVRASGDERRARALLTAAAEPGDRALGAAVAARGAAAVVAALRSGTPLPQVQGVRGRPSEGLRERLAGADAGAVLAAGERLGARLVVPGDLEWPTQLDDLGACAPFGLWVLGAPNLRLAALRSVAVVGTRAASPYGLRVACELGEGLGASGWAVVSGAALGVDGAAHRGCLAADGLTVAVLAGGVDVSYPRAHDALVARVADTGLVVSEAAPGHPPARHRFLERNRVIAALTRGTVVVEAPLRSGALSTAARAAALNRVVMAVPGPVTSPASAGANRLLRDHRAELVAGADEVRETVGDIGADLAPAAADGPAGPRPDAPPPRAALPLADVPPASVAPPEADDQRARVRAALPRAGAADLGAVATAAGLPVLVAAQVLGGLELDGLVRRDAAGWRRAGATGADAAGGTMGR